MEIPKAIEILNDILRFVKPGDPPDEHDALKLGIEALKRIESCRVGDAANVELPLSGETERRVK